MEKQFKELNQSAEGYFVTENIYYEPQGREISLIINAFANDLNIAIDGPTGSGKSTLAQRIAYILGVGYRDLPKLKNSELQKKLLEKIEPYKLTGFPMYSVECNEDLTADDLIGREIGIDGNWLNGPALLGAKYGGMLYLDEPAEARKDTLVVIHSLTDHRRILPVPKLGKVEECNNSMMTMTTYNSMYQDPRKKFKPSTAQRFVHLHLGYPEESLEKKIVMEITNIDETNAKRIIKIAQATRNLALERKVKEGASPREVVMAAKMIMGGENPFAVLMSTLAYPITQENDILQVIKQAIKDQDYKE